MTHIVTFSALQNLLRSALARLVANGIALEAEFLIALKRIVAIFTAKYTVESR